VDHSISRLDVTKGNKTWDTFQCVRFNAACLVVLCLVSFGTNQSNCLERTSMKYWVLVSSWTKYASICIARFTVFCPETWITQFYLQITPCLPLLTSRRTSPPFGWYSFYHPTEGRRLSRPGTL